MPANAEKLVIEQRQLGVRIVDDGKDILSGSYYLLYPVGSDWDSRLASTCNVIQAAASVGKSLHILENTPGVVSGEFNSKTGVTFPYGRTVTSTGMASIGCASLYGSETAEAIRGFILRTIASLAPRPSQAAAPATLPVAATAQGNSTFDSFANCCTQIAYLFRCCNPRYRQLVEEDELDLR